MSLNWTDEEIELLASHLSNLTVKGLYQLYVNNFGHKRSYDSVQKKIQKLKEVNEVLKKTEEENTSEYDGDNLSYSSDSTISPFQTSSDYTPFFLSSSPTFLFGKQSLQTSTASRVSEIKDWLASLEEVSNEIPKNLIDPTPVKSQKNSLIIQVSDTHFGKVTESFNLKEACSRMESIPHLILDRHPNYVEEVDEIIVCLVGDMVEGEDIYANQNTSIECSVIKQATICSESIWKMLLPFRALFKCEVRVETAPGNHGRMSKTANTESNWDNVVYHCLGLMGRLYKDPLLKINVNFNNFKTFKVRDKIGMLYHKGVKHTGTPAMKTRLDGWYYSKNFDFLIHGHWHNWKVDNVQGKVVASNGCMCGPDDFSEELAVEDNARQGYFLITEGEPLHSYSFLEW